LYFLAAGQHLAWGYVDMPPLIALLAWLAKGISGTSVTGIHVFPAIFKKLDFWTPFLTPSRARAKNKQHEHFLVVAAGPPMPFRGSKMGQTCLKQWKMVIFHQKSSK
jgi:hypothetical protein